MHRGIPTILVLLVVALGLWGFGYWLSHAGTPLLSQASIVTERPVPDNGWGPLRVMTANIRVDMPEDGANAWTHRRDFLVKTLLKYQPDILGCQEVTPAQGAFLNKSLDPWYAYFPRAGAGTQSKPPEASKLHGAAAQLVGAAGEMLSSLNTLYYRTDRFDLVDGESGMVLPDQLQPVGSENTFFTLAVLREKQSGKPGNKPLTLIAVDTHFRHEEAFADKCAVALRQKIAAWLEKFPNSGILVMGDMNHDRRSPMYDLLTGRTRPSASPQAPRDADTAPPLSDTFDYSDAAHSDWTTYHGFTGNAPRGNPSDLIFFGGPLQIATPAQIERDNDNGHYPSDHFFIMAELKANP